MDQSVQYRLTVDGRKLNTCDDLAEHLRLVRADSIQVMSVNGTGLPSLVNFPHLKRLARLSLDDNALTGGLEHLLECQDLHYISLCGNPISSVSALAPLGNLKELHALDLLHCPVRMLPGYRDAVFALIPSLKYLDGVSVYAAGNGIKKQRNDGIYSVVPILYLEVLREEDGDDGWDPVDAEGDAGDVGVLNEVMQDGWNQAPAGVEADELEGNNAANAGHVQGLGAEGNGIDQGLVEAYGIAVEYDEDAMDTDGSNGYAEDDEYDPNDDEDPFGHGYDEDWDELDSLTDDDDYDAVGRVMEGLSAGHLFLKIPPTVDDFDFEYSSEYNPDPYFTTSQIVRREEAVKAWYENEAAERQGQRFVLGGETYLGDFDSTCNHYECQHALRRLGPYTIAFLFKHRVFSLNTLTGVIRCIGRVHFMVYSMAAGEGYIALGGCNGWLAVFDITNDTARVVQLENNREYNNGMCFVRRGDEVRLLVANNDTNVYCLRLSDLAVVDRIQTPYACNDVQVSPDGRRIAIVGDGPAVCLCNVGDNFTLSSLVELPSCGDLQDRRQYVAWSCDSRRVAAGCNNSNTRNIMVWDTQRPSDAPDTFPTAGLTYAVDFSPTNPHLLMVAERDMLVHLIDVQAHARQTTSYLRLGSLRDYCIEALREAESMEQTGYVYKAKGGSRPTEQAGPAIPCDIIKSCGNPYWGMWRRIVRLREPGATSAGRAVTGRRRRSIVAPVWSEDEMSSDDDDGELTDEQRRHQQCGRACRDECHDSPYTDIDLEVAYTDQQTSEDADGSATLQKQEKDRKEDEDIAIEIIDLVKSDDHELMGPYQAAQFYHEKRMSLIQAIWVKTANERLARMGRYHDALDEYTLRRVFPFKKMLPATPEELFRFASANHVSL